ncbi:SOS response-associated peptidase [Mangrovimonas sp. AS39]|uniref:SOS response-associated peptidase n=1 Tax=Mangrovimonas futianensis TaxID=2895523 RepID=UPI001E51FBAB|nr:SOS response-associated peptidase family protein [Mangrovimonas futianensis]MCF1192492.1 SOS response-associated peptidase [Mangrovimonas futianensis]MCF1196178.1 SOS response-associated peptidase [Mangrovimonas futianensis]
MCFHTSTTNKVKKLEAFYSVDLVDESMRSFFDTPKYHLNGFSHPNMLVIPQEKSNVLAPGLWGIVPDNKQPDEIKPYFKEAVRYGGGLNAQSEKVFDHFIYRNSIMEHRCVIPVSGFFEPHDHNKKKYPFHIKPKEDSVLSLAGIYTMVGTYLTFTILTKKASPMFEKIHNLKKRQPVILSQEDAHNWLSVDLNQGDISSLLTETYPENLLEAYPVSKDLFSPKVDSNVSTILEKVQYEELSL